MIPVDTPVKIIAKPDSESGRVYPVVQSNEHAVWVVTRHGDKWRYWNYEVEVIEG